MLFRRTIGLLPRPILSAVSMALLPQCDVLIETMANICTRRAFVKSNDAVSFENE
jgi:hypothetical protein